MERIEIQRVLHFKVQSLKEASEGMDPDLQALAEAKLALLGDLLSFSQTLPSREMFLAAVEEDLRDAADAKRLSRNPFLAAALQVKIGMLEDVRGLVMDPEAMPRPARARGRRPLVLA